MFNLILFGPPGAGKGTQAVQIAAKYGWKHVSTGDILRAEVSQGTPRGLKVKSVMDAGHLVSDDLLIEIMESVFMKNDKAEGFVLDGFPRTVNQAVELDRMLKSHGRSVTLVLALEVDEAELVRRLLNRAREQGRMDDTEEVIKNRLVQYHQHTKPLIDYYRSQQLFREVHGVGTVAEIFEQLCVTIESV
ncbi:MAG TPA: adenylate kinase [Bacteroidales bacterium]|nr:adenylate kinase [Bacteroidales bacterium]HPS61846.1 adenylate kinase [Bacteroidales bacterium]